MHIVRIGGVSTEQHSAEAIGNKAANLARMAALGLPVPPAFVLPVKLCADIIDKDTHAERDLRDGLKRLTGEHGVDVAYDPVGGALAEPAVRSMAWQGRYLVIGFAAGEIPKLPLNLVLLKGCDIVGVFFGAFAQREPEKQAANMADIVRWCAGGKLSAHVHAVYPLAQTAQALKDIAARKVMGKAILHP